MFECDGCFYVGLALKGWGLVAGLWVGTGQFGGRMP